MSAEDDSSTLYLIIEANRGEARELLKALVAPLPPQISAVAGMMASVDLVSHMLFGSIDTIHETRKARGEDAPLDGIAREGVRMLQELLNIRLTYELAKRGILACDCPKCREEERAETAPINIKLH